MASEAFPQCKSLPKMQGDKQKQKKYKPIFLVGPLDIQGILVNLVLADGLASPLGLQKLAYYHSDLIEKKGEYQTIQRNPLLIYFDVFSNKRRITTIVISTVLHFLCSRRADFAPFVVFTYSRQLEQTICNRQIGYLQTVVELNKFQTVYVDPNC